MTKFVSLNARVTCRDDLALALKAVDLIWMRGVKVERCCRVGLDIMLVAQTIVQNGSMSFQSVAGSMATCLRLQVGSYEPYRVGDFVVARQPIRLTAKRYD